LADTLQASATQALQQLGRDADKVVAAGLATQRSSIVCWHKITGEPLSPVLSWQDTRGVDWIALYADHREEVHKATGLVLTPYYGVSKLIWCVENIGGVAEALAQGDLYCGPLASYLAQSLTGSAEAFADPANGSRTLLWDRHARGWSERLLQLFGVPDGCLPAAVSSRHRWGNLHLDGKSVPLAIVTGDQSAAVFAFGSPQPGSAYVNLGTGAFVQRAAPASAKPGQLLASVVYEDSQQTANVLEGTVNGAGSALTEITGQRGISRETLHSMSAQWLQEVVEPPLFINTIGGLGSPWWRTDIAPEFLPDAATDAMAVAAVMESIVFLLAENLRLLDNELGEASQIVATGGLAGVDPLLQKLADCSGHPVSRARVREATATGLAWLLADLPEDWPGVTEERLFSPSPNAALRQRYARWQKAMPAPADFSDTTR